MGSKRDSFFVCIVINAWLLWPLMVRGSEIYDKDSLDSYLHDYAIKKIHSPRGGRVYDVPLPGNLSGMDVALVRLRARSLWRNGANHSSFTIPHWIMPWPFAKRVDIVYQNLGNWSSSYYNVPNYTFVAPVVGFLAYDSNRSSTNYGLIELKVLGRDPIIVHFPDVLLHGNIKSMKCVRFDTNGTMEFSNVTVGNSSCVVRRQGHFSVVIPYHGRPDKDKGSKWLRVMGIAGGVVGLVLILVIVFEIYKWFERKKIRKMERESERSVNLEAIWIGRSRMPFASGMRTQPVLENSYLP